jgi:hypothetical protein
MNAHTLLVADQQAVINVVSKTIQLVTAVIPEMVFVPVVPALIIKNLVVRVRRILNA